MSLSDFSSTSDRPTNELTFYEMTFTQAKLEIEGDNDDRIKNRDMERHGETWKDMEDMKKTWKDMKDMRKTWRDLERHEKDMERLRKTWRDLSLSTREISMGRIWSESCCCALCCFFLLQQPSSIINFDSQQETNLQAIDLPLRD